MNGAVLDIMSSTHNPMIAKYAPLVAVHLGSWHAVKAAVAWTGRHGRKSARTIGSCLALLDMKYFRTSRLARSITPPNIVIHVPQAMNAIQVIARCALAAHQASIRRRKARRFAARVHQGALLASITPPSAPCAQPRSICHTADLADVIAVMQADIQHMTAHHIAKRAFQAPLLFREKTIALCAMLACIRQ